MANRPLAVRCAVVSLAAALGLFTLNYLAPLQWPTVAVYTGLVIVLCGLLGIVHPPQWIGVQSRRDAAMAVLGGVALLALGLLWPAATYAATGAALIDIVLPSYDFHEHHEIVVRASPERVMAAVHEVTFADIPVMQTLGRIRSAAMGTPRVAAGPVRPEPILRLIDARRTGFFPLGNSPREYVFGLAGRPWDNAAVRLTQENFAAWMAPGNVKVAANFRIDDLGNGSSRLVTETRVLATDDAARRTMARYWRLIYPGSGMIRRSLLSAIRDHAERPD